MNIPGISQQGLLPPAREGIEKRVLKAQGKLLVRQQASLKLYSLLQRLSRTEWSGVIFHRKISGSIERPETLVIEVLDFYLMDIGSTGFTSTSFSETGPQLTEYYDSHPNLMGDGIKTGYAHSHHSMNVFYSGEDEDDLVVNTRDKDVDYYLTLIINNSGYKIARVAFRISEQVEEKLTTHGSYFSTLMPKGMWKTKSTNNYSKSVLIMAPLEVSYEGLEELLAASARATFLEEKKEKERAAKYPPSYGGYSGAYNHIPYESERQKGTSGGKGKGQVEIFPKPRIVDPKDDAILRQELENDCLLGALLMNSMSYNGGLDAAVQAFRRRFSDDKGGPLEALLTLHLESLIDNCTTIVKRFEDGEVAVGYVINCLTELYNALVTDYVQNDDIDDCVDLFTDKLSDYLDDNIEDEETLEEAELLRQQTEGTNGDIRTTGSPI